MKILLIIFIFVSSLSSESITHYYQLWQDNYSKNKNYSEAINIYSKAIKEFPEEAYFYIFLGYSYQSNQQPIEGLVFLEKALSMNNNENNLIDYLFMGYYNVANHYLFKLNNPNKSIEYYKKALDIKQDSTLYNLLGNAYRINSQFYESYESFQKSFEINPNYLYQSKGLMDNFYFGVMEGMAGLFKKKEPDKAIAFGEIGLRYLKENRDQIAQKLMELYLNQKNYSKAESLANAFQDVKEKNLFLGLIKLSQDKTEEAETNFQNAILSDPESYELEEKIVEVYRFKLQGLNYKDQMNSKVHDKIIFHSNSMKNKYFKKNKYKQKIKFEPPLYNEFCVFQGEGGRSFHYGKAHYSYDLADCENDSTGIKVHSIANGVVQSLEINQADNPTGTDVDINAKSNFVVIEHGEGIKSNYYHIKQFSSNLKIGQKIKKGDIIGEIGNSGASSGPHLHISVTDKNSYSVPIKFEKLLRTKSDDKEGAMEKSNKLQLGYKYYPEK
jgi:murein DD-endopeptidase MepM/ murein hydrolase activator NlpD